MKNFAWDYLYLGFALSTFANVDFLNWEFYIILIPFAILNVLVNRKKWN